MNPYEQALWNVLKKMNIRLEIENQHPCRDAVRHDSIVRAVASAIKDISEEMAAARRAASSR